MSFDHKSGKYTTESPSASPEAADEMTQEGRDWLVARAREANKRPELSRTPKSWPIGWGCDKPCDYETGYFAWPFRWIASLQMKLHEWWNH